MLEPDHRYKLNGRTCGDSRLLVDFFRVVEDKTWPVINRIISTWQQHYYVTLSVVLSIPANEIDSLELQGAAMDPQIREKLNSAPEVPLSIPNKIFEGQITKRKLVEDLNYFIHASNRIRCFIYEARYKGYGLSQAMEVAGNLKMVLKMLETFEYISSKWYSDEFYILKKDHGLQIKLKMFNDEFTKAFVLTQESHLFIQLDRLYYFNEKFHDTLELETEKYSWALRYICIYWECIVITNRLLENTKHEELFKKSPIYNEYSNSQLAIPFDEYLYGVRFVHLGLYKEGKPSKKVMNQSLLTIYQSILVLFNSIEELDSDLIWIVARYGTMDEESKNADKIPRTLWPFFQNVHNKSFQLKEQFKNNYQALHELLLPCQHPDLYNRLRGSIALFFSWTSHFQQFSLRLSVMELMAVKKDRYVFSLMKTQCESLYKKLNLIVLLLQPQGVTAEEPAVEKLAKAPSTVVQLFSQLCLDASRLAKVISLNQSYVIRQNISVH